MIRRGSRLQEGWPLLFVSLAACAVPKETRPQVRTASAAVTTQPQLLATYRGLGSPSATIVAPAADADEERLYVGFRYNEHTIDVLAFEPNTGASTMLANPTPTEHGLSAMTLGPDRNVYFGTAPNAHFFKISTRDGKLVDLGRPSRTEHMIWEVTFGSDGKLYGGTWPSAKLVQFDPLTGHLADLGRVDPNEQYARYIAASDDGFVYAGIGSSRMRVVAYEIATGERRQLLRDEYQAPGFAQVYRATDGNIYAQVGRQYFAVSKWKLEPIDITRAGIRRSTNRMHDGKTLSIRGNKFVATDASGTAFERPFAYRGNELNIFRLGVGPDRALYASTIMPARLLRIDSSGVIHEVGELGTGEVYNFASRDHQLLMAGYATDAPLMAYDLRKSFERGSNPALVHFVDEDASWRPLALLGTIRAKIYVGAIAGYGRLDGQLCEWDLVSGAVETFTNLVPEQSVSALAQRNGLVLGGTSTVGGLGSHPTNAHAHIFEWDPAGRRVVRALELPGTTRVDNLVVTQDDDIYAIAGNILFVLDGESFQVTLRRELPFPGKTVWQSLAPDRNGVIWGLASEGIFTITPQSHEVKLVVRPPQRITAGFGLSRDRIFFASGAAIYSYVMPNAQ